MDILSRLIKFRDYTELSNSQFADKAGIPRPTLSQFLNGRNKRLSDDLASKLHAAYPQLNMLWLLFGEGDMLMNGNIEISEPKIVQHELDFEAVTPENQHNNDSQTFVSDMFADESIQKKETPRFEKRPTEGRNVSEIEKNEPIVSAFRSNPAKTVQYVMVFYTDSSFEVFRPTY